MKESRFKRNRAVLIIVIVWVVISAVTIYEMIFNRAEHNFFDLIIILATASGAFAVWYEFRKTKKLNEAVFINSLNTDFINTTMITDIYSKLYLSRENGEYERYRVERKSEYLTKEDIVKFNSYLNFFEIIYILINKKFINFEVINELFSHRFFLVTNDPVVQDMKLVKKKDHYKNIYDLHNMWRKYRLENDKKIWYEETCLSMYYDKK